jgi:soluble cytochrome b562
MKTPSDVIREMRESVGTSVWTRRLADELEAAMREPVAFLFGGPNGDQYCANHWPPQNPGKGKINPLFALPPDAAAEIKRLRECNTHSHNCMLHEVEVRDTEIERLTKEIEVQGRNVKALVKIAITKDHQIEQLDAKIERLSHAVRLAASQKLPDEMEAEDKEFADWEHGYKMLVKLARAAHAKDENK